MKVSAIAIGFAFLGWGTIASGAIANEATAPGVAMTDLDLPALTTAVPSVTVNNAPKLAEVLPEAANFTDVAPTHWAYGAVNSLTATYGCLAGYPDGTFRGEQFVTRYEFAAAMDGCLDSLLQLVEQERRTNTEAIFQDLSELERELGDLSGEVEAIDEGTP